MAAKKRRINALWFITAVMLVAVGLEYFLIGAGQPRERSASNIIKDLSKDTPRLIDPQTQLLNVIRNKNQIIFGHILLNTLYRDIDTLSFDETKLRYAIESVCIDQELVSLLEQDFTIQHVYFDQVGKKIGAFDVTTRECEQPLE
ncbi:MAG: hypothetical protein HKM24_05620 [Gammaproteobacteria bacterium]|nr:hypothetical protein [Gammaproteobacteria bacterium]